MRQYFKVRYNFFLTTKNRPKQNRTDYFRINSYYLYVLKHNIIALYGFIITYLSNTKTTQTPHNKYINNCPFGRPTNVYDVFKHNRISLIVQPCQYLCRTTHTPLWVYVIESTLNKTPHPNTSRLNINYFMSYSTISFVTIVPNDGSGGGMGGVHVDTTIHFPPFTVFQHITDRCVCVWVITSDEWVACKWW